jgi:protein TonB
MRPDRSLTVVTLVHGAALALLCGYALFAPKPKPVVAVFELVSAERPKLRPLAPKTPEPPPVEKPPESRPPEAPALTPKPKNPVPATKPEPKVARPTPPDTTLPVKEVARENSSPVQVENSPSDPRLAFWAGRVKKLVESRWNPPSGVDAQNGAKTVISFEVQRNGEIEDVSVKQSSGSVLLDDLAKRTIQRLEKVAPIPDNFPGDLLKVSYEFIYNGN